MNDALAKATFTLALAAVGILMFAETRPWRGDSQRRWKRAGLATAALAGVAAVALVWTSP